MKQLNFYIFLFALVGLCACSGNDEELAGFEKATQHFKLVMDVSLEDYDATPDTRATTAEWKDGSTIYLRFQTENGILAGQAKYEAKSKSWNCGTNGGLLTTDREMSVEAVYFDGKSSSNINGDIVSTDVLTAIYYAPNATYTYSSANNTIKLKATLSPMTGRMRFKSAGECKSLQLSGIVGYTGYNVLTGKFTTTGDATLSLDVDTAGYVGYIYGYYLNTSKPSITIIYTDSLTKKFKFEADMNVGSMDAGKSGWMNIPTTSKRSGWKVTYLRYKGHDLVDLALPSGLLWATHNVGATSMYDYGNYYAWGETTTKKTYTKDNSTMYGLSVENLKSRNYLDDNGNLALQYDAANKNWGGTWRMPTSKEFLELIANCKCNFKTWTVNNKSVYGIQLTSKINNNTIFLLYTGYCYEELTHLHAGTATSRGYYWSSTPMGNSSSVLYFYDSSIDIIDFNSRYYGIAIRPVTEP